MRFLKIFIVFFLLSQIAACGKQKEKTSKQETAEVSASKSDAKIQVDLFVMSKCPYGVLAENSFRSVLEKFGNNMAINLHFIGSFEKDGTPKSLHGDAEIKGNIAQLCAKEIAPDKQFNYVMCMNKDWRKIPNNQESCAQEVGIDKTKLNTCVNGDLGKKLLKESFASAKKKNVMGSPTIYINDKEYRGGRMPRDYIDHICKNYGEKKQLAFCRKLPPPPEVHITAITDSRCGEPCNPAQIFTSMVQVFKGLKATTLSWKSEEAQKIAAELGITKLPILFFDNTIENDPDGLAKIKQWLTTKGKYHILKIKQEFDPNAEICDNGKDDTGNNLVDCKDPTCKSSQTCRKETKGTLELFVMSKCPYGALAINAMKPVLKAFGNEMKFKVHFIADRIGDDFDSMHGTKEVAEDIRQLCAAKHYPDKYMEYLWCRYGDYKNDDWKSCTGTNKIDAEVIQKCTMSNEGPDMLAQEIQLTHAMNINGSPTWIANGRTKFSGIYPFDIQANFCKANPSFKGCKVTLPSRKDSDPVATGSCGN